MARYIDADEFMDKLNDAQIEFDENYKGLGKAKVMLSLQPTADVVDVKYGKWLQDFDGDYYCSKCGHYPKADVREYCPYCGAKNGC